MVCKFLKLSRRVLICKVQKQTMLNFMSKMDNILTINLLLNDSKTNFPSHKKGISSRTIVRQTLVPLDIEFVYTLLMHLISIRGLDSWAKNVTKLMQKKEVRGVEDQSKYIKYDKIIIDTTSNRIFKVVRSVHSCIICSMGFVLDLVTLKFFQKEKKIPYLCMNQYLWDHR